VVGIYELIVIFLKGSQNIGTDSLKFKAQAINQYRTKLAMEKLVQIKEISQ
jgi:hypothetical protein